MHTKSFFLKLENFDLYTPRGRLLKADICLELASGQMLSISGPNGSGKTTLIHHLLGELNRTQTSFEYVPQLASLRSSLPLTLGDVLNISIESFNQAELFGLGLLDSNHLSCPWDTASGGERKRALLSRAILLRPKVLILDEPFNHLDQQSISLIVKCLGKLLKEKKVDALIMVSHQCNFSGESFQGIEQIECAL